MIIKSIITKIIPQVLRVDAHAQLYQRRESHRAKDQV